MNPVTVYHSSVYVAVGLWSYVAGTDGSRAACEKITWSVSLIQVWIGQYARRYTDGLVGPSFTIDDLKKG
jgi:hypothetical protein